MSDDEKATPKASVAHPARAWVNEALNRLRAGDEPDSAIPLLRAAMAAFDDQPETAAEMAARLGFKPHGRPPG